MPARPFDWAHREQARRQVFGCLADAVVQARIHRALRDHATVEWFDTFAKVRAAIARSVCGTPAIVIGVTDACGESVETFVRDARAMTGISIVLCCEMSVLADSGRLSALAAEGVHDILIAGVNDDSYTARAVIFGAPLGGAGDVVMQALTPIVPATLLPFVNLVVRRPRELHRVTDVAAALRIPRQTIARWCRGARFMSPEELLVWARILLTTALLERTQQTLESIAADLHYASPTALRNRIKEYTGLTATEIRRGGVDAVMSVFIQRIEDGRCDAAAAVLSDGERSQQIA